MCLTCQQDARSLTHIFTPTPTEGPATLTHTRPHSPSGRIQSPALPLVPDPCKGPPCFYPPTLKQATTSGLPLKSEGWEPCHHQPHTLRHLPQVGSAVPVHGAAVHKWISFYQLPPPGVGWVEIRVDMTNHSGRAGSHWVALDQTPAV